MSPSAPLSAPASAPFGLYPSASFNATTQLKAGATFVLDRPLASGTGSVVFRRSLWLPLPAACRDASALQLADSQLELRFSPGELNLATDDPHWFSAVDDDRRQQTRLAFVWPATVIRIDGPHAGKPYAFGLHRADGEAVSAEATQRGQTGVALAPPWQGSPLVVRFDHPLPANVRADTIREAMLTRPRAQPQARAAAPPKGGEILQAQDAALAAEVGAFAQRRLTSTLVPGVAIAARPASPRLRLMLLEGGKERLLWQAIEPGEHATPVSLPGSALAQEWAAALEQIVATCRKLPPGADLPGLRLDIESDAPCLLSVPHAALALDAEYDLLAAPAAANADPDADQDTTADGLRLVFDGTRHSRLAIALPPPQAGARRALQLGGRIRCADTPAVGAEPAASGADARQGLLLEEDQRVEGRLALPTPSRVAGLALGWHPLSARLRGSLRVLPADARRGAPALLTQGFDFDTASASALRLAVRWPALDLQAQALRIEVGLQEGRGIWLSGSEGEDWRLHRDAGDPDGRGLALRLQLAWLLDDSADGTADGSVRRPSFHLGAQALPATGIETGRFSLLIAPPALDAWPAQPLCVESGIAAELAIERASLTLRLG